jgi:hypothetical protein
MSASSLKAIVVKELRENLQWAMLACVITTGFLSVGIYQGFGEGESITGYLFLRIYEFICPVVGLVIGLMQMLPEMRRGRWQFVTHRPVSRAALLLGKILVGIALYFLAAGVPVAIIAVWVAIPGHVPGPFAWNMLDQPLQYLYGGFAWYAAGLLVGCWRGRWFGSRLIPIGAAATIYFLWYFGVMVKPVVIGLFLAAAWGAYMAAGEIAQSRWWARASLVILLIAGWTVLIGIGTTFVGAAVGKNFWRWISVDRSPQFQAREGIELMGNVWLYTWGNDGNAELTIGDRISDDNRIENWQNPEVPYQVSLSDRVADFPSTLPVLLELFVPQANWFLVGQRRTIEGYDRHTNRYLGSIGLSGFVGPDGAPQPIPAGLKESWNAWFPLRNGGLLIYPDAVYHVHFSPPGIQKVYTAAPGDPVITAGMMLFASNISEQLDRADNYVAVETRNRIHIIWGSKELMSAPLDGRHSAGSIAVALLKYGEFAVAYFSDDPTEKSTRRVVRVYSHDGKLTNVWSFSEDPMSAFQSGPEIDWLSVCGDTGFCPMPLIMRVQAIQHSGDAAPLYVMTIVTLALFGAALSVVIAMSILRSRHATRPQVYLWIFVCAAFGVVGILTMAAVLNRMPRLRCVTCGRRMLPTESACVHCNSPAAPPTMRGIEILAPGMVLA